MKRMRYAVQPQLQYEAEPAPSVRLPGYPVYCLGTWVDPTRPDEVALDDSWNLNFSDVTNLALELDYTQYEFLVGQLNLAMRRNKGFYTIYKQHDTPLREKNMTRLLQEDFSIVDSASFQIIYLPGRNFNEEDLSLFEYGAKVHYRPPQEEADKHQ
jgi:hypothetical protein